MKEERKIVYIRENTLGSLVSDLFTFGSIVGSFWFNYRFIGGNNWLDVLLFLSFWLLAIGRAGNYRRLAELDKNKASKY